MEKYLSVTIQKLIQECLKMSIQKLKEERAWRLEYGYEDIEMQENIGKIKLELRKEFSKILNVSYNNKMLDDCLNSSHKSS